MTAIERFNLTWLANAMTDSPNSKRHYYYDVKNSKFFYAVHPDTDDGSIELLNALNFPLTGEEYFELFMRLASSNGYDEIVEIYRLGHAQKRDIQWQFLSRITGKKQHKYMNAVVNQKEEDRFVLDVVINHRGNERMFLLWEKFKLEVIRLYADSFERSTGVKFDLLS
jgi:hypothetical protein